MQEKMGGYLLCKYHRIRDNLIAVLSKNSSTKKVQILPHIYIEEKVGRGVDLETFYEIILQFKAISSFRVFIKMYSEYG